MRKGQAAITDALIFMLIASAAASLLLYVSGLYGSSTTKQVYFAYSNQFVKDSLVTLHYLDDSSGNRFWLEMRRQMDNVHLTGDRQNNDVQHALLAYLESNFFAVFDPLCKAAGARCDKNTDSDVTLCLETPGLKVCYPNYLAAYDAGGKSVYSAFVNFIDPKQRRWSATLKIFR